MDRREATLRHRRLGRKLRLLREHTGLTISEASKLIFISGSKISRIETAQAIPTLRDVMDMLSAYSVEGSEQNSFLNLMYTVQAEAQQRKRSDIGKLMVYRSFEDEAQAIWMYQALYVPGLFQVEEYARVMISDVVSQLIPSRHGEEIEHQVTLRMARQAILDRQEPPEVWLLLDEGALRRQVGDRSLMLKQLHSLIEAARLPTVTLQVLPFTAGAHVGMEAAFTILQFADLADPDVVHVEQPGPDLYLDDAIDVELHKLLFQHLRAVALNPGESTIFLLELADDL